MHFFLLLFNPIQKRDCDQKSISVKEVMSDQFAVFDQRTAYRGNALLRFLLLFKEMSGFCGNGRIELVLVTFC